MVKTHAKKSEATTTIQVSIAIHDKLYSIQELLKEILHKRKVSADDALRVLLEVKPLDIVLQDMILADVEVH